VFGEEIIYLRQRQMAKLRFKSHPSISLYSFHDTIHFLLQQAGGDLWSLFCCVWIQSSLRKRRGELRHRHKSHIPLSWPYTGTGSELKRTKGEATVYMNSGQD
jgi:hypothetical protein